MLTASLHHEKKRPPVTWRGAFRDRLEPEFDSDGERPRVRTHTHAEPDLVSAGVEGDVRLRRPVRAYSFVGTVLVEVRRQHTAVFHPTLRGHESGGGSNHRRRTVTRVSPSKSYDFPFIAISWFFECSIASIPAKVVSHQRSITRSSFLDP